MALSAASWIAIFVMVIGFLVLIIALFVQEYEIHKGTEKTYLWYIAVVGGVVMIIGGIWFAFTLRKPKPEIEVIGKGEATTLKSAVY